MQVFCLKKIFFLLSFIVLNSSVNCYAIEEVELESEKLNLDYFSDVYYGKIENNDNVSPILRLFSEKGYEFKNSPVNSVKFYFLYDGQLSFTSINHYSTHFRHDFTTIEPMVSVRFNEGRSELMFDYNLARNLEGYSNSFTQKISEFYISHKVTEQQTILIGQGARLPNSFDGSRGTMEREMILKSQLGRTFGEARSVGLRNIANYKYLEYDIGLYDSTRYMKDFGNGFDFTGHIMLKPFSNIKEKTGNLKIGTSYSIGKNNISYNTYSLFLGYDYKRLHFHTEYASADGYNGIFESKDNADGFYVLISYDITPKVSILGRYDYFTPNRNFLNSYCQEYTAGITYKLFKNMKIMLNYVNRNYSNRPNANMILFATRFII